MKAKWILLLLLLFLIFQELLSLNGFLVPPCQQVNKGINLRLRWNGHLTFKCSTPQGLATLAHVLSQTKTLSVEQSFRGYHLVTSQTHCCQDNSNLNNNNNNNNNNTTTTTTTLSTTTTVEDDIQLNAIFISHFFSFSVEHNEKSQQNVYIQRSSSTSTGVF